MSTSRRMLSAALVAATLSAATLGFSAGAFAGPPPPPPHHHHHRGPGWGWGIGGLAAGVMLGSALAPRPVYAEPVARCTLVERVNRYGEVIGTRRVCTDY